VPHTPGETLLKLEHLSGDPRPHDVQLDVRRGEILGVAGLVGSGRTELLRTTFGLDPVRGGQVRVGSNVVPHKPRASIAAGLGLVSEDRKNEGLALELSIADNMTLSRLSPYTQFAWLNLRRRDQAVDRCAQRVQLKARDHHQPVAQLSGGNQQKVAIARLLHQDAQVLLLDEPTRGIDVGTKAEIYRQMGALAAQGKAIVFVSSYLPELMAVCDRIAVMSRGRLREVRATSKWTEHEILSCAIGAED
jgi:ribose transport system ATP-binding protein